MLLQRVLIYRQGENHLKYHNRKYLDVNDVKALIFFFIILSISFEFKKEKVFILVR